MTSAHEHPFIEPLSDLRSRAVQNDLRLFDRAGAQSIDEVVAYWFAG